VSRENPNECSPAIRCGRGCDQTVATTVASVPSTVVATRPSRACSGEAEIASSLPQAASTNAHATSNAANRPMVIMTGPPGNARGERVFATNA
jgi:hypothetical protein